MAQKGGRPKATTDKVVSLLVTCFHNGLSVRQACWQSGISHEAYYQRLRNDVEFADTMNKAQELPSITARTNIMKAIRKGDVSTSRWWLERKEKDEFSSKADLTVQEEVVKMPSDDEMARIQQDIRRFKAMSEEEQLEEMERLLEDQRALVESEKRFRERAKQRNIELFGQETPPLDLPLPPHVRRKSDVVRKI